MKLQRGVMLGVVVALVLSLTAVSVILVMAWRAFLGNQQAEMDNLARLLTTRADLAVQQAADSLQELSTLGLRPCSPEHLYHVRRTIVATPAVDDAVYLGSTSPGCSRWEEELRQRMADATALQLPGAQAMRLAPAFPGADYGSLLLTEEEQGVLINLERFVDLVVEPGVSLALATRDEVLLAVAPPQAADAMRRLIRGDTGSDAPDWLSAVLHQDGWIAAAAAPRLGLLAFAREEARTLFPLLLLTGLLVFVLGLGVCLKHLTPVAEMRMALHRREFKVHYQPIIELSSGRCVGAEALLRWQRADGSMVRPDDFIPLAEESGLIRPLTNQLIDIVVREMGEALLADRQLHIALNLCVDDVATGRVLPVLNRALRRAGVEAHQIWLEVTERGVLDITAACKTLAKAHDLGYVVAIDDFGTGYANLQNLQGLPVDVLKIDKSFTDSLDAPTAAGTVVAHIIEMARGLELTVVAEGVETPEQAASLRERGVALAQGWLYAKAMPAEEFLAFCQRGQGGQPSPGAPEAALASETVA